MNIEANHATLACHTFEHELRVSAINGMLGSIDANQGDYLLGWDTDEFPFDVYSATLCMYEVLKAGGFNFDAKSRRPSHTYEDIIANKNILMFLSLIHISFLSHEVVHFLLNASLRTPVFLLMYIL